MRVHGRRGVVVTGIFALLVSVFSGAAVSEENLQGEVSYGFDGFESLEVDEPSSATITVAADAGMLPDDAPLRLLLTFAGDDGPLADTDLRVRAGTDGALVDAVTDDEGRVFAPADTEEPWTVDGDGLDVEVEVELTLPAGEYAVDAQLAATEEHDATVERLSGDGRIDTAVEVSQHAFREGASTAYIATGDDFPDALAGGPAAFAQDGPVLLAGQDFLPEVTAVELERLGVDTIRILGGTDAVDAEVETALGELGTVERFDGADRFETAALVATGAYEAGVDVAYVATGGEPWDALSGGAAAAATDGPILLAYGAELPEITTHALESLDAGEIRVLGGSEAISDEVVEDLERLTDGEVVRWSGTTRFDTSAEISAATFIPEKTSTAFMATGEEFADALTGVPGAGTAGAPVLLVGQGMLPEVIADELTRLGSEGDLDLVVLGGSAAVSDAVVDELAEYTTATPDPDAITALGDPAQEEFLVAVEEVRAFWADAFNPAIHDPEQVETLVDDALAANANTLIVQVVPWLDCLCNQSEYPRRHADIDDEPYDALETLIDVAHAEELEVHAWVNATVMWNQADPPPQDDHLFHEHGPAAEGHDRWLNRRVDGEEVMGSLAYLDPAHPDAVDYQVSAIGSIVENYDVDGINLDYIRYPDFNIDPDDPEEPREFESSWGYSEVSLARFQAETGRTDVPAPDDEEFSDWRRDQVTNMVQRIYLAMGQIDPHAKLSIDSTTFGFGPQEYGGWEETRAYTEVMQDWRRWMEMGIIDLNVAMNYKRNWEDPPEIIDQDIMFTQWTDFLADHQYNRHAVNGPALYLNEIGDSIAQLRETFEPTDDGNTLAGWSGYHYENVSLTAYEAEDRDVKREERSALFEALTQADPEGDEPVFAERARVPEMPWKGSEAHIEGSAGSASGGAVAELVSGGEVIATTRLDGSGMFGFIDVEPGDYQVVVEGTSADVTAENGGVARVNFGQRR